MELSSSKANNSVKTSTQSLNRHIAKLANRHIAKLANRLINKLANHFLVAKLLSEPLLQSCGIYFFSHFFALYSIFFQGVEQYSSRL